MLTLLSGLNGKLSKQPANKFRRSSESEFNSKLINITKFYIRIMYVWLLVPVRKPKPIRNLGPIDAKWSKLYAVDFNL